MNAAATTKLICDSPAHNSVPDKYVLPPEKRPCEHELLHDHLSAALPVVDLGEGRRQVTIGQIMEAGEEFGFFQAHVTCICTYDRRFIV